MYGIKAPGEPGDKEAKDHDDEDDDEPGDIEASINKELESFKNKPKPATREVFTIVKADLECLFFVKTMEPVDPTELVRRILQDARNCSGPGERKLRYINRLTPIVDTDRSTESGILKVARSVMAPHFLLKPEDASAVAEKEGEADRAKAEDKEDKEPKENDDSHPTVSTYEAFVSIEKPGPNLMRTSTLFGHPCATSRISEVWRLSTRLPLSFGQSTRSISQVLAKSCWSKYSRYIPITLLSIYLRIEYTWTDAKSGTASAN